MNIVKLCYHRIGGSGIVAYEIGRAMAEERGHDVHFVGLQPPFRLQNNFSESMHFHKIGVKEYHVFDFQPYSLALASQLSELIDRYAIDIIHSHYALPFAVSALLAKDISKKKVKTVTTLHGTDITIVGAHPSMINVTRYGIEKSDIVTTVSNHLARETVEKFGILPEKIKTIYNFINPDNFNPDLTCSSRCGKKDKMVLLHISNLRPVKRPLDVIKIFNRIVKSGDLPVELWIVGEGPMQYEMTNLAEELGIKDKVRFMGICANLAPVITSTDLLLQPSEKESFGLTVLEAMACGVPVAASRTGGLPEVIDDNRSGLLFDVGNIEEAATKIINLMKNREKYNEIREEGLKDSLNKFSMDNIISQYEQLYREILN